MITELRLRSTAAAIAALALVPVGLSLSACSGDDTTSSAPTDAGTDASLAQDGTVPPGDGASESSVPGDASADSPLGTSDASDAGDAGVDAGPPPHSACVPGVAINAGSDPCANTLCNLADDFYCCTTSWDLSCAEVAHALCASECPADPADGGIAKFGGTTHAIAQVTSRDGAECAVSVEGDVWCWGFEDILGDGSEQQVFFPRKIVGLPVATASVAMAGDAICALGVDGAVRCWGRSPAGSATTPIVTPPSTPILASASAIAGDRLLGTTDSSFLCAVVAGSAKCWGTVGSTLGPGVPDPTTTPTTVDLSSVAPPSTYVTGVFAGAQDTCVLVGDGGTPLCWGANTTGMIGHSGFGGTAPVIAPLTCLPASNADGGPDDCANAIGGIVKIAIGGGSTCMLDTSNRVWCLGDNTDGQLGTGATGGAFPYPPGHRRVVGLRHLARRDARVRGTAGRVGAGRVLGIRRVGPAGPDHHGRRGVRLSSAGDRPVRCDGTHGLHWSHMCAQVRWHRLVLGIEHRESARNGERRCAVSHSGAGFVRIVPVNAPSRCEAR